MCSSITRYIAIARRISSSSLKVKLIAPIPYSYHRPLDALHRIAGIESESRERGVARSGTLTLTLLLLARSLAPTTRRPLALVLVHRLAVPSTVSTTSLTPSPSDAPRGIGCSKLVGCCILQEPFTVSPSCYLLVHSRHGLELQLEHQLACSRHLSCSTTWLPSATRRRGSHLVPREREGGLLQPRHGHQP